MASQGRWGGLARRRRLAEFGLLGGLAGVGWWSSLEMTYFLVPSVILLVGAFIGLRSRRPIGPSAAELAVGLVAALIGALPWMWGSVLNHFGSIDLSTNSGGPPASYLARLSDFFHVQLPLVLGLRLPVMVGWRRHDDNAWLHPQVLSHVVYIVALVGIVAIVVLAARRGLAGVALAAGLVAFPFLYAASASSSGGVDGRYGVYFIPLLVLTAMAAVGRFGPVTSSRSGATRFRRLQGWVPVLSVLLAGITALTVVGFVQTGSDAVSAVPSFSARWGDPDAPIAAVVRQLGARHIKAVIADYWEAGDIVFVAGGTLGVVEVDLVRNAASNSQSLTRYQRFGGRVALLSAQSH